MERKEMTKLERIKLEKDYCYALHEWLRKFDDFEYLFKTLEHCNVEEEELDNERLNTKRIFSSLKRNSGNNAFGKETEGIFTQIMTVEEKYMAYENKRRKMDNSQGKEATALAVQNTLRELDESSIKVDDLSYVLRLK